MISFPEKIITRNEKGRRSRNSGEKTDAVSPMDQDLHKDMLKRLFGQSKESEQETDREKVRSRLNESKNKQTCFVED